VRNLGGVSAYPLIQVRLYFFVCGHKKSRILGGVIVTHSGFSTANIGLFLKMQQFYCFFLENSAFFVFVTY
jgi:hypothetical protein